MWASAQRLIWDYIIPFAIVWISMSICFNFYLLTNFLTSDVHPKLLIFHHWKFFEWWSSKIYDIRRDEWIKKLLYYTPKKKRTLSHGQSACDEDLFIYFMPSIFLFLKKKLCCKINRKCNRKNRQINKYLK